MKTNTYLQFKNWVKTTCIEKVCFGNTYSIYGSSTAHAIYTAWYMFKHNFSEQQVNEYIQKDIENSRKQFYNHGFRVSFDTPALSQHVEEKDRVLINIAPKPWNRYVEFESGGEYFNSGITQRSWTQVVKAIYEYWTNKLMEEKEVSNEK